MVKVIGPALSLDASGSLGKVFTYQKRMRGNAVYMKSKPGRIAPFVQGYNQYMITVYVSQAARCWHLLNSGEQAEWNDFVED